MISKPFTKTACALLLLLTPCKAALQAKVPDILKIYRVFDAPLFGPILMDESVDMLGQPIVQQALNAIQVDMWNGHRGGGEIRLGSTLNSVMIGTKAIQ